MERNVGMEPMSGQRTERWAWGNAGRTDWHIIEKHVPAASGQCSRADHTVTPVESVLRIRHLFGQLPFLTVTSIRLSQRWKPIRTESCR
jgi:hypothetical protein